MLDRRMFAILAATVACTSGRLEAQVKEKHDGYIDFRKGDLLIIDGQPVVAGPKMRVVKTQDWNASAMANGAVWVYTGLMDAMDDDELSIVMGHELAHYSYEHIRRNQSRGGLGSILGAGAQVAGAVIGGTAGALTQIGGQLGASALLSDYSREYEDQADRVGLRYVYEGGYDVTKGPALWGKFKEKYGETDKLSNFFTGDHSRPTERIKAIEREIDRNYDPPPEGGRAERR